MSNREGSQGRMSRRVVYRVVLRSMIKSFMIESTVTLQDIVVSWFAVGTRSGGLSEVEV